MPAPRLAILDVNETLSDLGPLRDRFDELGLGSELCATWFAGVLRDGFALSTLGQSATFADLGRDVLADLAPSLDSDGIASVIDTFGDLALHADVVGGLEALRDGGVETITLSNGSRGIAEGLLERAGVRHLVADVLSVDDAGVWKPHPRSYAYGLAARSLDADAASEAVMIAVHPWDLHGAAAAGLRTAWVRRGERAWPTAFTTPDHAADGFESTVRSILSAPEAQ